MQYKKSEILDEFNKKCSSLKKKEFGSVKP